MLFHIAGAAPNKSMEGDANLLRSGSGHPGHFLELVSRASQSEVTAATNLQAMQRGRKA